MLKNILALILFSGSILQGQEVYHLKPVVVTASRLMSAMTDSLRETVVLTREDIQALPARSIAELLESVGIVQVSKRGVAGVQSDFSMRGSSFEQVLILMDNVRIHDPQTGHHNSDIPVLLQDIERIEILAGHGSSMYGDAGFGGVIHIITRVPGRNRLQGRAQLGSYGEYSGSASQSLKYGGLASRFSAEKKKSDGYRYDTDYDMTTLSNQTSVQWSDASLESFIGWTSKDFGANGFYAAYPSKEKTKTLNGHLHFSWRRSRVRLQSRLFARQHNDHFILDIQRPDWYQNEHQTLVRGGEIQAEFTINPSVETALGMEVVDESVQSAGLGNHHRMRTSTFGEMVFRLSQRTVVDGGIRLDYQEAWGFQINPSLSVGVNWAGPLRWRASLGRVFRAPTYTELYYNSPANIGDPALQPEWGWSGETGLSWALGNQTHIEGTFFLRNERDLIDWIRYADNDPWQVANIGKVRVSGTSFQIRTQFGRHKISSYLMVVNRTALNAEEIISKYAFITPEFQWTANTLLKWRTNITQSITLDLRKKKHESLTPLMNTKITYTWRAMSFYIEMRNILNTEYEEIPGVPLPGRNFSTGITFF